MGDGSFLLVLPGEDRLHVSPEVCVWAQEGIKEQGHRALAPAFEAFRQVIQVLEGEHRSEGHRRKAAWSCLPTLISGCSDKLGNAAPPKEIMANGILKALTSPAAVIFRCHFAKPSVSQTYWSKHIFSAYCSEELVSCRRDFEKR